MYFGGSWAGELPRSGKVRVRTLWGQLELFATGMKQNLNAISSEMELQMWSEIL